MSEPTNPDAIAARIANNYIGEFAWPTLLLAAMVVTTWGGIPWLAHNGLLPLWAGLLPMALATYGAYTLLHEAAHGNISGSHQRWRWLNEALGYLAACIMMIPMTAHRHEHLAHHRNTNDPEGDPDYVVRDMGRSPWHACLAAIRITRSQYAYYHRHRWSKAPASQNRRFWYEVAGIVALRVALFAWLGWLPALVLVVFGWLIGVMITLYLFAYLVHRPHEARGRYVDTAVFLVPGPLGGLATLAWGFQNYHGIHHLFPRVPFYRYPALFRQIAGQMLAQGAPVYRLRLGRRPELLHENVTSLGLV